MVNTRSVRRENKSNPKKKNNNRHKKTQQDKLRIVTDKGRYLYDPFTETTYRIILNHHFARGPALIPKPKKHQPTASSSLKQQIPALPDYNTLMKSRKPKCVHQTIIVKRLHPQLKSINCKRCGEELRRWICPTDGINFTELMLQREYIFGPLPKFDWKSAHQLK